MDLRAEAKPDCPHCHGRGVVKGERRIEDRVCLCVTLSRRLKTAQARLQRALPPRARAMTLGTFITGGIDQNERALGAAKAFVKHYQQAAAKAWLLGFHGMPRTGKTHLAVGIAQACALRWGITPQLLNLPKALAQERERYNNPEAPSPFSEAKRAELLVLDDLGAEYQRQEDSSRVSWISEQLYDLLDSRLMDDLPLIYTTNLAPSDMERRFDNEQWRRVYSRLQEPQVSPPYEVLKVKDCRGADSTAKELLFAERSIEEDRQDEEEERHFMNLSRRSV